MSARQPSVLSSPPSRRCPPGRPERGSEHRSSSAGAPGGERAMLDSRHVRGHHRWTRGCCLWRGTWRGWGPGCRICPGSQGTGAGAIPTLQTALTYGAQSGGGTQAATPCPQRGLQGLCTLVSVQSCGQPGPRGPGKQCCSRVLPGAPEKPDTSSRLQPHPGRPRREGSACPQGSTEGAAALPNRASGRHGNHALKSKPLCPRGICHGKGGSEGPNPSGVCAGVPVLAAVITGSAWPRSHDLVPRPHW